MRFAPSNAIHPLIPAKAGIQMEYAEWAPERGAARIVAALVIWIPAFAGISGP